MIFFMTNTGRPSVRLTFDNGWSMSLLPSERPAEGVSCMSFQDGELTRRTSELGPQEATDDEVAAYIAEVKGRPHG